MWQPCIPRKKTPGPHREFTDMRTPGRGQWSALKTGKHARYNSQDNHVDRYPDGKTFAVTNILIKVIPASKEQYGLKIGVEDGYEALHPTDKIANNGKKIMD